MNKAIKTLSVELEKAHSAAVQASSTWAEDRRRALASGDDAQVKALDIELALAIIAQLQDAGN